VLLIGFVIFLFSYLGFAFVSDIFLTGILFVFYGLFQGIFRAVGKSFAADFVPQHLRASSIGWYSTVVGLSTLFASIVAGQLWDNVSHAAVFIYGSVFSFLGIILLLILVPQKIKSGK
jgi:MFS family permease